MNEELVAAEHKNYMVKSGRIKVNKWTLKKNLVRTILWTL